MRKWAKGMHFLATISVKMPDFSEELAVGVFSIQWHACHHWYQQLGWYWILAAGIFSLEQSPVESNTILTFWHLDMAPDFFDLTSVCQFFMLKQSISDYLVYNKEPWLIHSMRQMKVKSMSNRLDQFWLTEYGNGNGLLRSWRCQYQWGTGRMGAQMLALSGDVVLTGSWEGNESIGQKRKNVDDIYR